MASWLTCALCGVIQEVAVDDPMPLDWRPTADEQGILCPTCVKDSGLEQVMRDISGSIKQLQKDREIPPEIMAMPMDAPARERERLDTDDDE